MADLICRKTMTRCPTPGMCAPFQGCGEPKQPKESGFFDLPTWKQCTDPRHLAPNGIYIPTGKGYRHVCPSCGAEQIIIPMQVTM